MLLAVALIPALAIYSQVTVYLPRTIFWYSYMLGGNGTCVGTKTGQLESGSRFELGFHSDRNSSYLNFVLVECRPKSASLSTHHRLAVWSFSNIIIMDLIAVACPLPDYRICKCCIWVVLTVPFVYMSSMTQLLYRKYSNCFPVTFLNNVHVRHWRHINERDRLYDSNTAVAETVTGMQRL